MLTSPNHGKPWFRRCLMLGGRDSFGFVDPTEICKVWAPKTKIIRSWLGRGCALLWGLGLRYWYAYRMGKIAYLLPLGGRLQHLSNWLVVWMFLIDPQVGNTNPNWRTHNFQRLWNHQPVNRTDNIQVLWRWPWTQRCHIFLSPEESVARRILTAQLLGSAVDGGSVLILLRFFVGTV